MANISRAVLCKNCGNDHMSSGNDYMERGDKEGTVEIVVKVVVNTVSAKV